MTSRGRIVEWSQERGFGFLESGGQRIFLHWRDFKERHKRPEVGDVVLFTLGNDRQGRTCATEAVHVNDGGSIRAIDLLVLALMLSLPVAAVWRVATERAFGAAMLWGLLVSAATYLVYAVDKGSARVHVWRVKESHLHLMELLGGWPGAFLAQRNFRHKATKAKFQIYFILIVGLHEVLAIYVLND